MGTNQPTFSDSDEAGLVVAVGQAAAQTARMYAQQTARHVRICEDAFALTGLQVDVVVMLALDLSARILDLLYGDARRRLAPGLILGANEIELMECGQRLLARLSTRAATLERLSGHGDGVDAFVNAGTILCSIKDRRIQPGSHPACCVKTGRCFRTGSPLSRIDQEAGVRAASSIEADVLVMDVCNGLSLGGQVDFQSSLASAILTDSRVQAVALPWTTYVRQGDPFDDLVCQLRAGEQIGVAVARLNASFGQDNPGLRMAVLGEPRTRLLPEGGSGSPCKEPMGTIADPAGPAGHDPVPSSSRALEGFPPRSDLDSVPEIVRTGGVYFHTWTRQCWAIADIATKTCPYCGASSVRYGFDATGGCSQARQLLVCPKCAVISDAPPGSILRITYDTGEFDIERSSAHAGVIAIRLACKDHSLSRVWLLEGTIDRRLRLALGGSPPPGPLRLQVVCAVSGQVHVAALPISPQMVREIFAPRPASSTALLLQ